MTNGSAFAYVADGRNGLRVVQIISANDTPGAYGFTPRPTPYLVSTYATHGPAMASRGGLDRDRAVDETGNQLGVFGRRGARPFNREEQQCGCTCSTARSSPSRPAAGSGGPEGGRLLGSVSRGRHPRGPSDPAHVLCPVQRPIGERGRAVQGTRPRPERGGDDGSQPIGRQRSLPALRLARPVRQPAGRVLSDDLHPIALGLKY